MSPSPRPRPDTLGVPSVRRSGLALACLEQAARAGPAAGSSHFATLLSPAYRGRAAALGVFHIFQTVGY